MTKEEIIQKLHISTKGTREMKYIHKLWSWKFRVLTILLLACAFTARYADGIIYAVLNTFGVYAIYALGQFTADEIRKVQEK